MKEYLNPLKDGGYELSSDALCEDSIEVPETWMNFVYRMPDGEIRYSDNIVSAIKQYIIWQRPSHPEPLPFIDDNPQSLNDQYAEIEQVRQNQKTIDAMREAEGIFGKKHSHYRKSVKHLDFIDPYRIAQLYDLHPCADHIAKKALCTGKRGHKDLMRDIQDIIDTAERWKQMIQEDQNAI